MLCIGYKEDYSFQPIILIRLHAQHYGPHFKFQCMSIWDGRNMGPREKPESKALVTWCTYHVNFFDRNHWQHMYRNVDFTWRTWKRKESFQLSPSVILWWSIPPHCHMILHNDIVQKLIPAILKPRSHRLKQSAVNECSKLKRHSAQFFCVPIPLSYK